MACAPASNTGSERIYSQARLIVTDKRIRLESHTINVFVVGACIIKCLENMNINPKLFDWYFTSTISNHYHQNLRCWSLIELYACTRVLASSSRFLNYCWPSVCGLVLGIVVGWRARRAPHVARARHLWRARAARAAPLLTMARGARGARQRGALWRARRARRIYGMHVGMTLNIVIVDPPRIDHFWVCTDL